MKNLTSTQVATMTADEFNSLILNSDIVTITHFPGISTSYDLSDEFRARAFTEMIDSIRQSALATA